MVMTVIRGFICDSMERHNEAVEKLLEGSNKSNFGGHLTIPEVMIVEYDAF